MSRPRAATGTRGTGWTAWTRSHGGHRAHLLAVHMARNRLPPRTTSACPHRASPTGHAMDTARQRCHPCASRPAAAPDSDVRDVGRDSVRAGAAPLRKGRPRACADVTFLFPLART